MAGIESSMTPEHCKEFVAETASKGMGGMHTSGKLTRTSGA